MPISSIACAIDWEMPESVIITSMQSKLQILPNPASSEFGRIRQNDGA